MFTNALYGDTKGPGKINVNKGSLSIYDFYLPDKSDSYGKTKILEQDIDIDHGDVTMNENMDVNGGRAELYGDTTINST